jgi:ribonuclease J
MNDNELYFVPLGGAGEFGMNLNAYGYNGKWLIVDCGMGFGDGIRPGIDILLPNPKFLEERKRDIVGMVITHAHEDHIGAISHLWPRLKCPIYASPFAAELIEGRFVEKGMTDLSHLIDVDPGSTIDLHPFQVEMVRMTHSTLEPSLLAIRTPAGLVVHTGDWKLDPNPVLGERTDEARLRQLGEEGVLAVIGDSTNSTVPGWTRSEGELEESLTRVFSKFKNRIGVTCFSSNAARMVSIYRAAAANGRKTALVGRSIWRIEDAAREAGYMDDIPDFLTEHELASTPADKLVVICTGSQGEPRSALSRISEGDHPYARLERGDAIVFSARPVPGNEKAITALQSRLAKNGVQVVTPDEEFVHVSGHPAQEELTTLYQWLRPACVIPVHGEYPQLTEHARIARDCQVAHTLVPENGQMIRLAPGPIEVVDHVESGHLALDGTRIVDLDSAALRTRQKISFDGVVLCSLVMDRKGRLLVDPALSAPGLLSSDNDNKGLNASVQKLRDGIEALPVELLRRDSDLYESVRLILRKHFSAVCGKKPWIDIHIARVE